MSTVLDEATERIYPWLFTLFVDLHRHPELGFEEHRTTEIVASELRGIGFQVRTSDAVTGVVGIFENGAGPVVALRADIDALPIEEKTGLAYSSEFAEPGKKGTAMHACGHDIHAAALLGAARLLSDTRDEWAGTILVLAQPAEELGEGARRLIASGLLDGLPAPEIVIAQHVGGRGEDDGVLFASRPGVYEAGQRNWRVTGRGPGGHAAGPHRAVNPLVFISQVILRTQSALATAIEAGEKVVLVPTTVHAGTGSNIIADEATATFCARAFSEDVLDVVDAEITRIVEGFAQVEGLDSFAVERFNQFPINANDPEAFSAAKRLLEDEFGEGSFGVSAPILGSEDFGELPKHWGSPSIYWHFEAGVSPEARDEEAARRGHSSTFAPDPEIALRRGTRALTAVARGFLIGARAGGESS